MPTPTLLLWGERDAVFSRGDQDALLTGIAGSRLVTYPETGHAPHWERPEPFARDLEAFLAGG
jgi:non-heme chloroperoxidase